MNGVVRQLDVERFARCHLTLHERDSSIADTKDVFGVGIFVQAGTTVFGVAVVLIEAVTSGAAAAQMPFAEVGRRVVSALKNFGDRDLAIGQ